MSRQKKALAGTRADSKNNSHSHFSKPISKYRAKQCHTAMGAALLAALRGGQQ